MASKKAHPLPQIPSISQRVFVPGGIDIFQKDHLQSVPISRCSRGRSAEQQVVGDYTGPVAERRTHVLQAAEVGAVARSRQVCICIGWKQLSY